MTARLDPRIPAGDGDGLAPITGQLIHNPSKLHVLIAICDTRKAVTDYDRGEVIPVVRIRRIEVVRPSDLAAAEKLMRRALEERSGETVLSLDLEDELTEAFASVEQEQADGDDK